MFKSLLTLSLLFLSFLPSTAYSQTTTDITSKIENLGNPSKAKYLDNTPCVYARNVWDLFSFEGQIYIGSGNSANSGSCPNAGHALGPIPIYVYSPTSGTFSSEGTVNEEQINKFMTLDGVLTIPGHDMIDSGAITYYRKENDVWVRYRKNSGSDHVFDIRNFKGKWFAGVGGADFTTTLIMASASNPLGATWTSTNTPLGINGRIYDLFEVGGYLYGADVWNQTGSNGGLYQNSDGTSFAIQSQVKFNVIFPNTDPAVAPGGTASARLSRPTNFGNSLVYIGSSTAFDAPNADPFGLYKLDQVSPTGGANFASASKLALPGNAAPFDILVSGNKLYVLGGVKNGSRYWVTVNSTTDLNNWTEEFRFDAPTYARSFELLNGNFYFGLGTYSISLSPATGDILRYKPSITPSPSVSGKLGDTDGDNDIDIFDYNQLLTDYGKRNDSITKADLDNDDDVDIFDYNLLLTNYGK